MSLLKHPTTVRADEGPHAAIHDDLQMGQQADRTQAAYNGSEVEEGGRKGKLAAHFAILFTTSLPSPIASRRGRGNISTKREDCVPGPL